jgi:hypothetical protein
VDFEKSALALCISAGNGDEAVEAIGRTRKPAGF